MSRIAIICPPATGHVHPSIALATALRDRQHNVEFFLIAPIGRNVASIEAAGFACRIYGNESLGEYLQGAYAKLGTLSGTAALKLMVEIVRRRAAETMHLIPTLLAEHQIEFTLIDQLLPCASTAAQAHGIPFATISNALIINSDPVIPPCFLPWMPDATGHRLRNWIAHALFSHFTRPVMKVLNDYRSHHGLPRLSGMDAVVSEQLQLSQQPEFFEFPRSVSRPSLHYCGPFLRAACRQPVAFPWDRLRDRPLIYFSMGTLQNRLMHVFRIVSEACVDLNVDLVITAGGSDMLLSDSLPGQPICVQFAPQPELLKRAAVCITHAGLNTALECLSAGVPMLAIPIANDQPGVAARIEYLGFGRRLTQRSLTVAGLRQAITLLLNDKPIHAAVTAASQKLQGIDGCHRAAELIENTIRNQKPVIATSSSPFACVRFIRNNGFDSGDVQ